jgi:two-component system chemotaxis response regulator CheB
VLSALPAAFPIPVAICHHRGDSPGEGLLAGLLKRHSGLPVLEVEDKTPIGPGRVYLAPGGYHLLVEGDHFALSVDDPEASSRPSINTLFESAADAYCPQVVGVILTGANDDGVRGLTAIKAKGGLTVAQDPADAESPVMPAAAIAARAVDLVLPLQGIGPFLVSLTEPQGAVQPENDQG